jgi:hypothetical protein
LETEQKETRIKGTKARRAKPKKNGWQLTPRTKKAVNSVGEMESIVGFFC